MNKLYPALPIGLFLFAADCTTKDLAVEYLTPEHEPHAVIGDVVRFTLGYNDGAAMSLPVGPHARWPLIILSFVAFLALGRMLWQTPPTEKLRRVALGLLMGGTLGNLLSRLFSSKGVVDFIDIGFGNSRFWVFNVADVGITVGAILLAYSLWRAAPPDPTAA
jgi:signal peptidase II